MARKQSVHVCQACGAVHPRWSGRCDSCGAWNSLVEEAEPGSTPGPGRRGRVIRFARLDEAGPGTELPRTLSGIAELDRVTGGGFVPGSAVLIGGDPGIGKSTLLLQAAARLAIAGVSCAYLSGEEAVAQIRMRAQRLGLADAPVRLAAATEVGDIAATLESAEAPRVAVIDSIQTMYIEALESAPGTVAQVRASAQALIRAAKRRDVCVVMVGHVTKEGQIAGPRVLEHMVDTVLYFEGERGHQFRILRAVKNRFGATDEIGVFEMTDRGLQEVPNPSELFLGARSGARASGSAVLAGMEGTRPVLVEVQALVAASPYGTPRRTVVGWDSNRLAMLTAVLDARCGLATGARDVFLNVAGGLRLAEPAADLAVAAALVSSLADRAVPDDTVLFGEIGLSGEVRPVGQAEQRLKEAAKLGFRRAVAPPGAARHGAGLEVFEVQHLAELVDRIAGAAVA